jgi:hypothetical protein
MSAIDLAHPACAERRLNLVGSQLCSGCKRHLWGAIIAPSERYVRHLSSIRTH